MDALKLFYESKFGPVRGRAAERVPSAAQGAAAGPSAADRLLRRIEAHAGRPLRADDAVDAYFNELADPAHVGRPTARSLLRETVLVLLLLVAVLQYYYIDVSLQIASLNHVTVFVPTERLAPRARRLTARTAQASGITPIALISIR